MREQFAPSPCGVRADLVSVVHGVQFYIILKLMLKICLRNCALEVPLLISYCLHCQHLELEELNLGEIVYGGLH